MKSILDKLTMNWKDLTDKRNKEKLISRFDANLFLLHVKQKDDKITFFYNKPNYK